MSTKKRKKKNKKGGGRLQSWFGNSFNAAQKAYFKRKKDGKDHQLARVVKRNGEVSYYVGKPLHVKALSQRPGYEVELKRK